MELLTSRGESEPPNPRYDEHHDRRSVLFWRTSCLERRKAGKFHGALSDRSEASGSGCGPCVFNLHFFCRFPLLPSPGDAGRILVRAETIENW